MLQAQPARPAPPKVERVAPSPSHSAALLAPPAQLDTLTLVLDPRYGAAFEKESASQQKRVISRAAHYRILSATS